MLFALRTRESSLEHLNEICQQPYQYLPACTASSCSLSILWGGGISFVLQQLAYFSDYQLDFDDDDVNQTVRR